MVRRFNLIFILLFIPLFLFAGEGKIAGTVVDKATGNPLAGVNIIVEDAAYTLGSASDMNGYYAIISVPDGVYTVRATYMGKKTVRISNVRVSSGLTTELTFELEDVVLEGEVVEVTAERKLFRKDATSNVGIADAEQIENLPVRGTQALIENMAGVVVQDGNVHIRGGRDDEVGYYVNGVSTIDPTRNTQAVHVITEAVEEIQVLTGGYTAEMGGATSGIVKTELKDGSPKLTGSVDVRADGFGDPEEGNEFLNTYTYGHQTGVVTLSGPLVSDKITFFVAGEYENKDDGLVRFSDGFEFKEMIDMSPYNAVKDTVDLIYPDGFTPKEGFKRGSMNGTLTFDLPIRVTLGGMYQNQRQDVSSAPMLSLLNDRVPYNDYTSTLLTAKLTKTFSSTSLFEVKLSYFGSTFERGDGWFDHDWEKYYDSAAVYDYSAKHYDEPVAYRDAWRPKYNYSIHGFPVNRPGAPNNYYFIEKQNYIGATADYKIQLGKHHEIKTGIDYRIYTIRSFDIAPSVMQYAATDGTMPFKTYGSIDAVPVDLWNLNGGVDAYGFDLYGNEIDEDKEYRSEDGTLLVVTEAPKKPVNFSAYLQDKIEYNDLIVNAGLRLDYFDADDKDLKDPENPTVDKDAQMLADEAWEESGPFIELQPRLGFSFPTGPKTVFYLQYGKFTQMPEYSNMYTSTPFTLARQVVRQGYYFLNPVGFGLDPIRTTNYELGWRQQIADNAALEVTAFYKNIKGLIQTIKTLPDPGSDIPGTYMRLENGDFATNKGLEMRLTLRRSNRLQGQVNYTYTDAEGTASNSTANQAAVYSNTVLPTTINPLDYSQKHTGSINLDYRFGKNDGGPVLSQLGINLLMKFSSGHPFTYVYADIGGQADPYTAGIDYMDDTRTRHALEPVGSSTTPWTFTTDLRLDKSFDIGRFKATAYIIVNNLFNKKNVLNVYESTGSADNDGFLSDLERSQSTINSYGGQNYIDMYRAINLKNGQAYWNSIGRQLWDNPRQIHFGIKFSF
ncbi:MAG: TonB-dependent receptor [Candidatus Marinimicrobia bacterium]|nr:TonB-dependent receptor [Candidatus Neomarinimicrobiota bacterium]